MGAKAPSFVEMMMMAEMEKPKIGDVVRLKSGSDEMTVTGFLDGLVLSYWNYEKSELVTVGPIPAEALMKRCD